VHGGISKMGKIGAVYFKRPCPDNHAVQGWYPGFLAGISVDHPTMIIYEIISSDDDDDNLYVLGKEDIKQRGFKFQTETDENKVACRIRDILTRVLQDVDTQCPSKNQK
jgi:hypothetical protein